jgi:hypothetical protein
MLFNGSGLCNDLSDNYNTFIYVNESIIVYLHIE